jgi:hypothetical protein
MLLAQLPIAVLLFKSYETQKLFKLLSRVNRLGGTRRAAKHHAVTRREIGVCFWTYRFHELHYFGYHITINAICSVLNMDCVLPLKQQDDPLADGLLRKPVAIIPRKDGTRDLSTDGRDEFPIRMACIHRTVCCSSTQSAG